MEESPSKKPRSDFKDKKPSWQRVNTVYTPLTVPINRAEEVTDLLARPKSFRDGHRPRLDKFLSVP
ncbi:UNVERIFIED_CONTAM: hypothetical protein Sradi_6434000 [Sesamum radiatum]|uniref:Uncharacterized protein n=1 Tax=Sesamum radiatum TaxID=300843 RepID=A0AAW2K4V4_SESRA